jgi:cation:H+ antiporter
VDQPWVAALSIIGGLVLLTGGGEMLVRGSSAIAAAARISPLVIGLTVVAFGTSAPELAVSLQSAWRGQADLAVGNVVGSNIFNVLCILGISSLIVPLVVSSQLIRIDVPIMVIISASLMGLGWDGRITRIEGLLLVAALLTYVIWSIWASRRERLDVKDEFAREFGGAPRRGLKTIGLNLAWIAVGLALLAGGSQLLVGGAVRVARWMEISELLIGLTIVAAGTSLPEVAASVIAALRGERDIAVGNAIGSNIFNILAVLGITALAAPQGVAVSPAALHFDIPVMIAVAVACLPVFFTGARIDRWEGVLFLGGYLAYTAYLILNALEHQLIDEFRWVMGVFVLPIVTITLIACVLHALRKPNESAV